jgi:hypothetical protein
MRRLSRARRYRTSLALLVATLMSASPAPAATAVEDAQSGKYLPPPLPWHGKSETLLARAGDPWITPAEKSGLKDSPDYDTTVAWLRRLVDAAPQLQMVSLGKSYQQRDIWMVIASEEGARTPEDLRANGRPTLLAQAGIHSGEIDGKDAGLMLLRDMTVDSKVPELLEGANFLFIPILSVDAHERSSAFSRVNQRGPTVQGWRTNARNQNLNRDYAKLDTPEMRAVVAALNSWPVDLYLDIHVTDGVDYQYDITYGFNEKAWSPAIGSWLRTHARVALDRDLKAMGHVPGDLVFAVDSRDMSKGIYRWTAGPRFSHGYGDARHLPTILIENHSLKDYRRRVLGTRVFLASALRLLAREGASLRTAVAKDRTARRETISSSWQVPKLQPGSTRDLIQFLAVKSALVPSPVTGDSVVRWLGEPETLRIPVLATTEGTQILQRPVAYWIPAAWPEIIERLRIHGVQMELLRAERMQSVEMLRLHDLKLAQQPYEGHVRVETELSAETKTERFAAGSARIPCDQPLGDLAMLLLEPRSPDSFFQWGFFLSILSRTEYVEPYVMEPMARTMLKENADLRQDFERKLKEDPGFAKDPRARLQWFYEKTPYYDQRYRLYPVGIER